MSLQWKHHSLPTMVEAEKARTNTLDNHGKSTAAEAAADIKAAATWDIKAATEDDLLSIERWLVCRTTVTDAYCKNHFKWPNLLP